MPGRVGAELAAPVGAPAPASVGPPRPVASEAPALEVIRRYFDAEGAIYLISQSVYRSRDFVLNHRFFLGSGSFDARFDNLFALLDTRCTDILHGLWLKLDGAVVQLCDEV